MPLSSLQRNARRLADRLAVLVVVVLAATGCGDPVADADAQPAPPPSGPMMLPLSGDVRHVHDPVLVEEDGRYYLFSTGEGISIRCSADLLAWRSCGAVLPGLPDWARAAIPGATDHLWAPDVVVLDGVYHLYYSVSTFGSQRSAIGLATSPTLDPGSPDYGWTDRGPVVQSFPGDDYNAIDPNVVLDESGAAWMVFGSHWGGIMAVALDAATGKPEGDDAEIHVLARRPASPAIEAPFVVFRDGYYYLFASYDACCRGIESTYNVRVGRSEHATGPYLDAAGTPMTAGGGTRIISATDRWKGTGHQAVFEDDGRLYLVYHAYDAFNDGVPTLQISPLVWADGWPSVEQD